MKKLSVILLSLLLCACQLAKEDSTSDPVISDQNQYHDPLIGIMVKVYDQNEHNSMIDNEQDAVCTLDDRGDYACYFEDDAYYLSLWPLANDDNKLYYLNSDDTPLIVTENNQHYELLEEPELEFDLGDNPDDTSSEPVASNITKEASVELNLQSIQSRVYIIELYQVFYDKENDRVYRSKNTANFAVLDQTDIGIGNQITIEYKQEGFKEVDGLKTSTSENIKLTVNTAYTPEDYTLYEYGENGQLLLRKELTANEFEDDYSPNDNCAYLVLSENNAKQSEHKIYDRSDTSMEVDYKFDEMVVAKKTVTINW